jgi:hypothetical protein
VADGMSDFQQIAANPPGGPQQPDPRFGEELQRAIGGMKEFQTNIVAQNKIQQDPLAGVQSASMNYQTGEMTWKVHKDVVEGLMQDHQELNQIRGAFAQEAQRLKIQEDAARQQPWVQLATALSANIAQQPNMPGFVKALGATAAQLNPTADQLGARRMGVLNQQAQMAEKSAALDVAQLNSMQTGSRIAHEEEAKRKTEEGKRIKNFMSDARLSAKTGEPMPRDAFEAKADMFEIPQSARDALYGGHVSQAMATVGAEERHQGQKKDLLTTANQLAISKGISLLNAGTGQKMSLMREAFALNHGQDALNFEKAKKEVGASIAMGLAQAKSTGVLGASDIDKLQGGLSTNTYLGSLNNMLNIPELGHVAEPLFVVDRGKDGSVDGVRLNPEAALPKAWQSVSRAEADNMLKHEIPRLLNLLFKQGVGAQMFRSKEGGKILTDLGVSSNMRLDQMQSILKTIRETNNLSNFAPVAKTKYGVNWADPNNAAMLAMDDGENAEFWSGKDRFGGKIPVARPGTANSTTPVLSRAGYDAWVKSQSGSK